MSIREAAAFFLTAVNSFDAKASTRVTGRAPPHETVPRYFRGAAPGTNESRGILGGWRELAPHACVLTATLGKELHHEEVLCPVRHSRRRGRKLEEIHRFRKSQGHVGRYDEGLGQVDEGS